MFDGRYNDDKKRYEWENNHVTRLLFDLAKLLTPEEKLVSYCNNVFIKTPNEALLIIVDTALQYYNYISTDEQNFLLAMKDALEE